MNCLAYSKEFEFESLGRIGEILTEQKYKVD